jgi:transposase
MSAARQRWTERFARYRLSKQTVAAFCADEHVWVPSFYLWKRKLAAATQAPLLLPIQLTALPPAAIELVLPSGTLLRLPADYSPHQLATLLTTLEARSC